MTYNWSRLWCPRGRAIGISDSGYSRVRQSSWTGTALTDAVPLESISSVQCLVLLGEPGMGKTFAMQTERKSIDSRVTQLGGVTCWLDLRAFGDENRLVRELFENTTFQAWKDSNYQLHLFLDSLDEALLRIDTISAILSVELGKYPVERLYLRIACRTADWPNDLEEGLCNLWEEGTVMVYELAPLQRRDVIEAAQANELDPAAFIDEIDRVGVAPLASKPVTLDLLINTYRRSGNLPSSQTELYGQGCRLLCDLPSRHPSPTIRAHYTLTSDQRLAVAARIAAITLFSRKFAVWTELDRGDVPQEDVTIRELAGGKEQCNGALFDITERGVREALGTGLFSARGLNRLGWSHQTYAEFLAARYLVQNTLTPPQMMRSVVHSEDAEKRLVPQLRETAAWLASMSPEVFREITKCDPEVLLKSDVAKADFKEREALVRSLLTQYDQGRLVDFDWDLQKAYRKLDYPDLADLVCPYILDNSKGAIVRRVAINIAEACHLAVIQTELADLALNRSAPPMIRVEAAYAVSRIADDATKARLKPLALISGDDDPDDQLKGVALSVLWPSQLTTEELFAALTPPKREYLVGAYQAFISPKLVEHIKAVDLPTALRWAETQIPPAGSGPATVFSDVIDAIMLKAWAHITEQGVLEAFASAALARLQHFDGIVGDRGRADDSTQQFATELLSQDDKRHQLVEAMLPLVRDLERNWVLLSLRAPLLPQKDISWLVDRLKAAATERDRQMWAMLIGKLASWSDPVELDRLIEKTQDYPSLICTLKKIKAAYPERERLRQEFQREQPVTLLDPPPQERVAALLDKCEQRDSAAWWCLNMEMSLIPTSTHYGDSFQSNLTAFPGWISADESTRVRIVEAGRRFLLEQDPTVSGWLPEANVIYRPLLAAYRAFELLLRTSPASAGELPSDIWKKWVPAIFAFPNKSSSDDTYHGQLIDLAYQHAPEEVVRTVLETIDQENQATGNIFVTFQLRSCWDDRLSNALLEKLGDSALKPNSVGCLLRDLLDRRTAGAKEVAQSLVQMSSGDEQERAKAVVAAEALLAHADDAGWSTVWPVIQRNMEFGKAVVAALANGLERSATNVAQKLSEDQIADFYLWVERSYPHSEDPQTEAAFHAVGDREIIGHWRDSLLQHLKNRGTAQSVTAMQRIVHELPELHWLRWTLLETRDLARRGTWKPVSAADVIRLGASQRRAPVRWQVAAAGLIAIELIVVLLSVGASLIAGWIQKDLLSNVFSPQVVVITMVLMALQIALVGWLRGRVANVL